MNLCKTEATISRSGADILRVLFETLVLIHHLFPTQTALGSHISTILGPMAVSGFLLLSGYGVGMNYKRKGELYLNTLIKGRIPRTYGLIVFTNVCYLLLFFLTGKSFPSFFALLTSVLNAPIVSGSVTLSNWLYFLSDLMIYYLLFWLFMQLFEHRRDRLLHTAKTLLMFAISVACVLCLINITTGSTRYLRGCLAFPIGIFIAHYDGELIKILSKFKYLIAGVLFIVALALSIAFIDQRFLFEYVINVMFSLSIVVLAFGFNPQNKWIKVASRHVIIVYLSHELFFKLLKYHRPDLSSYLIMLVTVACAILFAVLWRKVLDEYKEKVLSALLIGWVNTHAFFMGLKPKLLQSYAKLKPIVLGKINELIEAYNDF